MKPRPPRIHQILRLSRKLSTGAKVISNMAGKCTYPIGVLSFELRDTSSTERVQRLGKLSLKNRIPIDTPHFFPISSRGCVPHFSQDMTRSVSSINGIYVALEDCECSSHAISRGLKCRMRIDICHGASKSSKNPQVRHYRFTRRR